MNKLGATNSALTCYSQVMVKPQGEIEKAHNKCVVLTSSASQAFRLGLRYLERTDSVSGRI